MPQKRHISETKADAPAQILGSGWSQKREREEEPLKKHTHTHIHVSYMVLNGKIKPLLLLVKQFVVGKTFGCVWSVKIAVYTCRYGCFPCVRPIPDVQRREDHTQTAVYVCNGDKMHSATNTTRLQKQHVTVNMFTCYSKSVNVCECCSALSDLYLRFSLLLVKFSSVMTTL